ncbi:MAG: hypothetical protein IKK98_02130, partial [Oscillospiraceae bacterium]|nr:hypothetical protein [Oscillospiraceae bacterium]
HVPLGMDGEKRKNQMAAMLGIGIGGSLYFLLTYFSARSDLFGYINGKLQRIPNRRMLPFEELLSGTFTIMAIMALGFVIMAVMFYLYHYQGCRSIYTQGQDNNLAACRFYLKHGFVIGGLDTMVYNGTSQQGKSDVIFYLDL